jgi:uncharacterized membrane protein (UPF0127 family)
MVLENFSFYLNGKKKNVRVRRCESIFSKFLGIMFQGNFVPHLFVFKKEQRITIHSFFCVPFVGIWLDKNKKAVAVKKIHPFNPYIYHRGMYLLEIQEKDFLQLKNRKKSRRENLRGKRKV